jgi:hypothetical protein
MNVMLNSFGRYCLIALLILSGSAMLLAQGPPTRIDTCLIAKPMRFKAMPIPSKFVPGDFEELRGCSNLGNSLLNIPKAKIGKAANLTLLLRLAGGKLVRLQASTKGEKEFEKLYKQVVLEAGRPTKMVESQGKLTYSWGVRSKLKGQLELHYTPTTQVAVVTILP